MTIPARCGRDQVPQIEARRRPDQRHPFRDREAPIRATRSHNGHLADLVIVWHHILRARAWHSPSKVVTRFSKPRRGGRRHAIHDWLRETGSREPFALLQSPTASHGWRAFARHGVVAPRASSLPEGFPGMMRRSRRSVVPGCALIACTGNLRLAYSAPIWGAAQRSSTCSSVLSSRCCCWAECSARSARFRSSPRQPASTTVPDFRRRGPRLDKRPAALRGQGRLSTTSFIAPAHNCRPVNPHISSSL